MLQLSANYAIVLMGKAREATYPQQIVTLPHMRSVATIASSGGYFLPLKTV